MSILVVDDESRMRKLIKDFLQKNEYEVIEAVNGEDAGDISVPVRLITKENVKQDIEEQAELKKELEGYK